MKISGQIFQEAVNRVKNPAQVNQQKPEETRSDAPIQDRVSISSENRPAEVQGYSPEELRTDKAAETRNEKVARIKEAVESNNYNVSMEKVAEKITGAHINEII
jgi:anti-sigma28 factor (negative regulator of flagellin synthesis)